MRLTEFLRPGSVAEAHRMMQELGPAGLVLAGGTALNFMRDETPKVVVDITRLGLSFIRQEGEFFAVGATTPLVDLQRFRAPGWELHEICRRIATQQIRNLSTIGGNVCRVFPWADTPVALLAMDARFVVQSDREVVLGAYEFFEHQPAQRFSNGDILTSIRVPLLLPGQGMGTVKVVRTAAAFSMATVVAFLQLDGNRISRARVAAGSAIPFPRRLPSVEQALTGAEASVESFREAAKKAGFDAPWRGREGMSPEYSLHLAEVTIVDALELAASSAHRRARS